MRVAVVLLVLCAIVVVVRSDIPRRSYVASFGDNQAGRLGRETDALLPVVKIPCPKQRCFVRSLSVANSFVVMSGGQGDVAWGSNMRGQLPGIAITSEDVLPTKLTSTSSSDGTRYVVLDDACIVITNTDAFGYGSNDNGQLSAIGANGWSTSSPEAPSPPTPFGTPTPSPLPPSPSPSIPSMGAPSVASPESSPNIPTPSPSPSSPPGGPISFDTGPMVGKRATDEEIEEKPRMLREENEFFANANPSVPPIFSDDEHIPPSIQPKSVTCAGTRCFYRNTTAPHWWGYWGEASYDPLYDFSSEPIKPIIASKNITNIVHSTTTAVFQLGPGRLHKAVGKFLEVSDPSTNVPISDLPLACEVSYLLGIIANNAKNTSMAIDVGEGFVIYVCDDQKSMYAFGNNSHGQLGDHTYTGDYVPGIDSAIMPAIGHRKVSLNLDANDFIIDIAAGKASSYVLTDSGNVYGWGYTGSEALGDESKIPLAQNHILRVPILLNYYDSVKALYLAVAIRATSSTHGVFVGLAMRPGGTNACPKLPAALTTLIDTSDPNVIFCDIQGYYNFVQMAMGATTSMTLDAPMKLRGDMQMSGQASMTSLGGMTMEGDMNFFDDASATITGGGAIEGSLGMFNESRLELKDTNVAISGDVNVGNGASITFSGLSNFLLDDASAPVIDVSGSTTVDGAVKVTITRADIDKIVSELKKQKKRENSLKLREKYEVEDENNLKNKEINDENKKEYLDSPDGPQIEPTLAPIDEEVFNTTVSLVLVASTEGVTAGSSFASGLTLAQPSDPCSSASGEFQSSGQSLSLVLTVTTDSSCSPSSKPANSFGKNSKTTGIIVGSVVGGVILLALIALVIILTVPAIRRVVLPYRGVSGKRNRNMLTATYNV